MAKRPVGAAFFDLDRTLLAGGSGPVFAATLKRLGVSTPRVPGQDALFRLFDLVGESYVLMQFARQATRRIAGLERAMVQAAAEVAADDVLALLQPYAAATLAEHRGAGDLLVLATTSPFDLVVPVARRLGFDALVATRFEVVDGVYTGELDGPFAWGPGKLDAVRAWAAENGVDVAASAAYSDSIFDAPLLSAVGRPVAVNPDARLRVLATLRRWPVRSLDVPSGVPSVGGVEPYDFVRTLARSELFPAARFTFDGIEHIPTTGPAIVAANHRSYFDPIALGYAIGKAGRNPRFLGKKEVFDAPIVGTLARALGGIRVDRGSGSDEPLRQAAAALEAGEIVVILPQGTIPRGQAFFEPLLEGRSGVARLAAMVDAPVIPVGLWGTEKVWPRSSKVPNVLNVASPPDVCIRVGAAVRGLARTAAVGSTRIDTERVMAAIMALLPNEARVRRDPSAEELARATPRGARPAASGPARVAPTRRLGGSLADR